ncbi:MAG: hypothetical protein ACOC9Y_00880 [Chloroflexota bacterium]
MRVFLALLLTTLLLAACSIDDDETPTPTTEVVTSTPTSESSSDDEESSDEPAATATATDEEAVSTETDEAGASAEDDAEPTATESTDEPEGDTGEVEAEVADIEDEIVDVRGLELLNEISVEIIDRETLRGRVEELVSEDYTQEEADQETLTYWLLGLLPDRDLDLYQLQVDLLEEQIAGYYDPETEDLVVVTRDGELRAIDKVTTAHEIVHALQDQHFDLSAMDETVEEEDAGFAQTALIEGDATVAMTLYMLERLDPMEMAEIFEESMFEADNYEVLENAPPYVAESLTFPYESGQIFVEALYQEGGFDRVNQAFEDPPSSTEQILHPEKYLDEERDEPMEVSTTDLTGTLGEGWETVTGDTIGEWDIGIMLDEMGAENSTDAAAGWGGSEYTIYRSDSDALATLTTVWDTDEDRAEFLEALQGALDNLDQEGDLALDDDRYLTVVEDGDQITLVTGTNADNVFSAASAIGS